MIPSPWTPNPQPIIPGLNILADYHNTCKLELNIILFKLSITNRIININ